MLLVGKLKIHDLCQNKGQNECVAAFISAVKNGHPAPIAFNEVIEVTRITIELATTRMKINLDIIVELG